MDPSVTVLQPDLPLGGLLPKDQGTVEAHQGFLVPVLTQIAQPFRKLLLHRLQFRLPLRQIPYGTVETRAAAPKAFDGIPRAEQIIKARDIRRGAVVALVTNGPLQFRGNSVEFRAGACEFLYFVLMGCLGIPHPVRSIRPSGAERLNLLLPRGRCVDVCDALRVPIASQITEVSFQFGFKCLQINLAIGEIADRFVESAPCPLNAFHSLRLTQETCMRDGLFGVLGFLPEPFPKFVTGCACLLNLILETVQPLDCALRQVGVVGQVRKLCLAVLQGFPVLPDVQQTLHLSPFPLGVPPGTVGFQQLGVVGFPPCNQVPILHRLFAQFLEPFVALGQFRQEFRQLLGTAPWSEQPFLPFPQVRGEVR